MARNENRVVTRRQPFTLADLERFIAHARAVGVTDAAQVFARSGWSGKLQEISVINNLTHWQVSQLINEGDDE
jgi:hypothetical protein